MRSEACVQCEMMLLGILDAAELLSGKDAAIGYIYPAFRVGLGEGRHLAEELYVCQFGRGGGAVYWLIACG